MDAFLTWTSTAGGAVLVVLALRDVFHTLWHPTGRGGLSRRLMAGVWWVGRRRRGGQKSLGGPLAMVVVVLAWAAMIVVGAALVYWPHLDDGFSLGSQLQPERRGGPLDALYVSLVTTATLGFGDIVPTAGWLRVAVPVQALIGFALLTAAVTWILQLYPALIRRRALATRLSDLRRIDTAAMTGSEEGTLAVQVLDDLAGAFAQARVDLTQYPETYYFRDGDADTALAGRARVAAELAEAAQRAPGLDVRLAGQLLDNALAGYLAVVDRTFLHAGAPTPELLGAYAADHGYAGRDGGPTPSAAAERRSRK